MKTKIIAVSIIAALTSLAQAQTAPVYVVGGVTNQTQFANVNVTDHQNGGSTLSQINYDSILVGAGAGTIYSGPSIQVNNVSVGNGSHSGLYGTAIGTNATAVSPKITPYTSPEDIYKYQGSTAVGLGSTSFNGSTAIGKASIAACENCVAIGGDTTNMYDNTVAIGNRKLTQVERGTEDTDATNVAQVSQAKQEAIESSNSYTDRKDLVTNQRIDKLEDKINGFDSRINTLDRRLDKLGAIALASSALTPNPHVAGNNQYALGLGTYRGSKAIAGALYHYSDDKKRQYHIRFSASGGERGIGLGFASGF